MKHQFTSVHGEKDRLSRSLDLKSKITFSHNLQNLRIGGTGEGILRFIFYIIVLLASKRGKEEVEQHPSKIDFLYKY